jgi:hypothetical protein
MATPILPSPPSTNILNPDNVSGLVVNKGSLNTLQSIQKPQAFGDQLKDITKQKIIASATQGRLTKLLKEKAALIKEGIQLDIKHNTYVNITLEQKRTPKKQIVNGKETDIPAELTEAEYQTALILENGGTLPNGQVIKGNYPSAKENLDKRKQENQKQIDDFLKDPFAKQKAKLKELKLRRKKRKKRSKEEKRNAKRARLKSILKSARAAKALAPVAMVMISNKVAEIISQSDRIGKLVNDTNRIIEEANLSNDPVKLQTAQISRNNAVRIITDNENKLKKINSDIQRISTYISIFSIIVTIISAIPIPTAVPPGIGIPTNLIIKFVKILDKANRIVLILGSYIPSVLMTLDKAIQILRDYKSRLLNINGAIDNASTNSENPEDFLTPVQGTQSPSGADFPEYNGFKFALREEDNPKFIVRGYKRRYAVAINASGVEVLKSEYSFTLDPNDLIEQLKLLIDQRGLSAYSRNPNPFGSGAGTGRGGIGGAGTGANTTQLLLSTPSSSTVSTAKKAAFTQPPQEKTIKAGPFTQKIPLSLKEKAMYAGIAAGSPEPSSKVGAIKILAEDRKWQAAFKRYRNKASSDILKLES